MESYTNGSSPGAEGGVSLKMRFDAFKRSDEERETLVRELVSQYEYLQRMYQQKCQDHDSEIHVRRLCQKEAHDMKGMLSGMKSDLGRDQFVVALIDGDGAIFQGALLAAASDGGSDAAHRLLTEIKKHLLEKYDEAAASWSVMVYVYCSMDGLGRKLASIGLLQTPSEMHAFARAFTLNQPLFHFIDVGAGKERADFKIKEMLRLFIGNSHCKHVIFGGCHDNGYLPNLDSYKHDSTIASRISLLETTPMQPGFRNLNFTILEIPSVFRSTPLPENAPPPARITLPVRQSPVAHTVSHAIASPKATPPATTDGGSTWATVGKSTPTPRSISVASSKQPPQKVIFNNKDNQRLDQPLARPDKAAYERLQARIAKNKVCNDYHLRGQCGAGYCPYDHGDKLSPMELLALRNKARQRSCPDGLACEDFGCFNGHNCPNQPQCFYEDTCYFKEVHGIDRTVKYKYYEDGREEVVA